MGPEEFKRFKSSEVAFFSRIRPRNIFPGEWESNDRGDGIEFAEIKPYEPGDDLRDLDLQSYVQTGEEEIIYRVVERQMKMYVWLDLSGSMRRFSRMFFAHKPVIRDIALGLLLFSACNSYNPVGLCAFNQKMLKFFPARVGETHCWEIIHWLIAEENETYTTGSDIQAAISGLLQRAIPHSMVFLVSDFEDLVFNDNFTGLLQPVVKKFDLVPIIIQDPLVTRGRIKRPVRMTLQDNEAGNILDFYFTPEKLIEMQRGAARRRGMLEENFLSLGVRPVVLDSPSIEDGYRTLCGYFQNRRREAAKAGG